MTDLTDLQESWNALYDHIKSGADDTHDGERDELRAQVVHDAQAFLYDANGEIDEVNVQIARGMGDPRPSVRNGCLYLEIPVAVDENGDVVIEEVAIEPPSEEDDDE